MTTIRQLLDSKGHDIISISPNDSVYNAIALMSNEGIGTVVVLENGKLIGMISERDYARKVILKGKNSKEIRVREIMLTEFPCVRQENTVEECMALSSESHVRHLPVLDNGKLIGIVSLGDLVKQIISDKDFTISQLEHYICGDR